jgi:hypothetical protein
MGSWIVWALLSAAFAALTATGVLLIGSGAVVVALS